MLIAGMEDALLMDRQAADPASPQRPVREGAGRVIEVRAVQAGLPAVTALVERDGMHVDPAIARRPQLNPRRQLIRLGGIPENTERVQALLQVTRIDRKIKIAVFAGLPAGQDCDTPAAANPGTDARLTQGIQDTGHFLKAHGGSLITQPSAITASPLNHRHRPGRPGACCARPPSEPDVHVPRP